MWVLVKCAKCGAEQEFDNYNPFTCGECEHTEFIYVSR